MLDWSKRVQKSQQCPTGRLRAKSLFMKWRALRNLDNALPTRASGYAHSLARNSRFSVKPGMCELPAEEFATTRRGPKFGACYLARRFRRIGSRPFSAGIPQFLKPAFVRKPFHGRFQDREGRRFLLATATPIALADVAGIQIVRFGPIAHPLLHCAKIKLAEVQIRSIRPSRQANDKIPNLSAKRFRSRIGNLLQAESSEFCVSGIPSRPYFIC